jgi:hypothetical protein
MELVMTAAVDDGLARVLRDAALQGARLALDEQRRDPIILPEFLNQQQAARFCGWSEVFFNETCKAGKGPRCVRVGSKVRYRPAWLIAWMEAGAHAPNAEAA